jgi:hypothetical protein
MSLQQAFENLKNAIGDLSSLDVISYSGTLSAAIQADDQGNIIDWDKLVTEAKKEEGKVSLKLASHFKFDGDATLFSSSGDIPVSLRSAHNEAVKAGQQIRKDLFELFSGVVNDLVKI